MPKLNQLVIFVIFNKNMSCITKILFSILINLIHFIYCKFSF